MEVIIGEKYRRYIIRAPRDNNECARASLRDSLLISSSRIISIYNSYTHVTYFRYTYICTLYYITRWIYTRTNNPFAPRTRRKCNTVVQTQLRRRTVSRSLSRAVREIVSHYPPLAILLSAPFIYSFFFFSFKTQLGNIYRYMYRTIRDACYQRARSRTQ